LPDHFNRINRLSDGNKTSAKIKSLTDVIEKMAADKTDVDIDVKAEGEI